MSRRFLIFCGFFCNPHSFVYNLPLFFPRFSNSLRMRKRLTRCFLGVDPHPSLVGRVTLLYNTYCQQPTMMFIFKICLQYMITCRSIHHKCHFSICRTLAEIFSLTNDKSDLKSAILLDLYFYTLQYPLKQKQSE